ncbi:MAG: hypothetical protein ABEJ80_02625 [Halarchaeum sp.]
MSGARRFVRAWVAWSFVLVPGLWAASSLTPTNWAVGSALGALSLGALTAPAHVRPPWRERLRLPLAAAALAVLVVVAVVLRNQAEALLASL